ncbi:MAG: substrate-binding domain-containing protein [Treponema sp.]|jgi:phosphate transport system substrate-binding protein|nr:substrate-binding domain-containing protein [Treponema sp.]
MKKLAVILFFSSFSSAVFGYGITGIWYSASASSALEERYDADNLIDGTWQSWAEGSNGNGVGEYFTLFLSEYNDTETITGFALKNGYGNIDYFVKNNRVKAFKIYIIEDYIGKYYEDENGTYTETIAVKDSISFEQYYFKKPVKCKAIRFVIDDVYPGTMYNDTCIAEIALLGNVYDEQTFYENILFWVGKPEEWGSEYLSNDERVKSVADNDKIMLLDYLPFDFTGKLGSYYERKTKIARLNRSASLRLNDNLPRIDGATAMYPLYSSFVHAVYPEKQPVETDSYRHSLLNWEYYPNLDLYNIYHSETGLGNQEDFKSIVQCNTTSTAYQRLIDGETDIVFCYEPSSAEIRAAAAKGKRFNLTPICKDAFVFIVNEKNIVNNITKKQIQNIYSGRLTNWKSISGADEPIIAYQRPENSGSQTILQSIMKGDIITRPVLEGEFVSTRMSGYIKKVTSQFYNYNCAIGYTFLYYLTQMAGGAGVKTLSVDGIAPNKQTVQNNTYPFIQTVYAVTAGNESENTKKFIAWILSPQGQELAEKTGYIPLK